MGELGYGVYAVCHAGLLLWALRLFRRERTAGGVCLIALLLGLVYDNLVLAFGGVLGWGAVLEGLSWGRFGLHELITPTIAVVVIDLAARAGIGWALGRWSQLIAWVGTLLLISFGVLVDYRSLELAPSLREGVVRYSAVAVAGPPIPALTVTLVAIVVGFMLGRRGSWAMLIGAGVMLIGSGLSGALGSPMLGSGCEVVMLSGMLLTSAWVQHAARSPRTVTPQVAPST